MPGYQRILFNGNAGKSWTNDTGKIQYQLIVNWSNTCGVCAQYDHAIGPAWPLPYHRSCRCRQVVVAPAQTAQPWVDFRQIASGLNDAGKRALVGASNYKLIKEGVVEWKDVVTPYRVRALREVVSLKKLQVKDLTAAGVRKTIAETAYATVNTPVHQLVEQQRKQLVANLQGAGLSKQNIADIAARGLASRFTIASGPSGPQGPKVREPDADFVRAFLASFKPTKMRAAMKPKKKAEPAKPEPPRPAPEPPKAAPAIMAMTVEEFADRALDAAKAVPAADRYAETKVWVIDAFEQFRKTHPGATIGEFKRRLVEANQGRKITLARFDLPGQVTKELRAKDDASETSQGVATFNQIRLPD